MRSMRPDAGGAASAPAAPLSDHARSAGRNPYEPNLLADPYVVAQHRAVVEALERGCAQSGVHCEEARQARDYLNRRPARR